MHRQHSEKKTTFTAYEKEGSEGLTPSTAAHRKNELTEREFSLVKRTEALMNQRAELLGMMLDNCGSFREKTLPAAEAEIASHLAMKGLDVTGMPDYEKNPTVGENQYRYLLLMFPKCRDAKRQDDQNQRILKLIGSERAQCGNAVLELARMASKMLEAA